MLSVVPILDVATPPVVPIIFSKQSKSTAPSKAATSAFAGFYAVIPGAGAVMTPFHSARSGLASPPWPGISRHPLKILPLTKL